MQIHDIDKLDYFTYTRPPLQEIQSEKGGGKEGEEREEEKRGENYVKPLQIQIVDALKFPLTFFGDPCTPGDPMLFLSGAFCTVAGMSPPPPPPAPPGPMDPAGAPCWRYCC